MAFTDTHVLGAFPAPLEVDRELYKLDVKHDRYTSNWFPAPLEVDRYLYLTLAFEQSCQDLSFRPLAR